LACWLAYGFAGFSACSGCPNRVSCHATACLWPCLQVQEPPPCTAALSLLREGRCVCTRGRPCVVVFAYSTQGSLCVPVALRYCDLLSHVAFISSRQNRAVSLHAHAPPCVVTGMLPFLLRSVGVLDFLALSSRLVILDAAQALRVTPLRGRGLLLSLFRACLRRSLQTRVRRRARRRPHVPRCPSSTDYFPLLIVIVNQCS
jgi:hypothetical protein